jgi:hypothetical protein
VALVALLAFPDIEIGNPKTPKISTNTPHCLFSGTSPSELVESGWADPVLADFAASGIFLDEIILSTSDKSAQGYKCPNGVKVVCTTEIGTLGYGPVDALYMPDRCLMVFDVKYCPNGIPVVPPEDVIHDQLPLDLPLRSPVEWLEHFKRQAEKSNSAKTCLDACLHVHEGRHAVDFAEDPSIKRCQTETKAFRDQDECLRNCSKKHCDWGRALGQWNDCQAIWRGIRATEAAIMVNKCICKRTLPGEPSGPKDPICEDCYNECKDGGFDSNYEGFDSELCRIIVDLYCKPFHRADLCEKQESIDPAIGF